MDRDAEELVAALDIAVFLPIMRALVQFVNVCDAAGISPAELLNRLEQAEFRARQRKMRAYAEDLMARAEAE
jgi:hypothetical protein